MAFVNHKRSKMFFSLTVAIELIVQHIRDFLNNRGRSIEAELQSNKVETNEENSESVASTSTPTTPVHGKKKTDSHSMHRPH